MRRNARLQLSAGSLLLGKKGAHPSPLTAPKDGRTGVNSIFPPHRLSSRCIFTAEECCWSQMLPRCPSHSNPKGNARPKQKQAHGEVFLPGSEKTTPRAGWKTFASPPPPRIGGDVGPARLSAERQPSATHQMRVSAQPAVSISPGESLASPHFSMGQHQSQRQEGPCPPFGSLAQKPEQGVEPGVCYS